MVQVAWFRATRVAREVVSAAAQVEAVARVALAEAPTAAVPMAAGICRRPTPPAPMAEEIRSRLTRAPLRGWASRAATVIWATAPQARPRYPLSWWVPPSCCNDCAGAARTMP